MTKTNLFDKFIDVEFTIDKDGKEGAKLISFKTPKYGVKPNVAIYAEMVPNLQTANITLKLVNFYSEINIALYKYVKIKAGYKDGPFTIFKGEIFNCYVEKPNPEGVTIFSCTNGTISDMYSVLDPLPIVLKDETVTSMLGKCAYAFGMESNIQLPQVWKDIKVPLGTREHTLDFATPLLMKVWLANQIKSLAVGLNLPLLHISVVSGTLSVYALTKESSNETAILLDKVSTAYFNGGNIIVKAPWNPLILADSIFKMDARFFRGRMGSLQVKGELKTFRVISLSLAFSTTSENSMDVNAIDIEWEPTV